MGYDKRFTDALQFVWGEGFLSPGGEDEVEQLLRGHDIRGLAVLDIGSGLGGVDLLLAERHGAGHVTGIDIDPWLVSQAQTLIEERGLSHRVEFRAVAPGPLPFDDRSFDAVFSKDAMIHIPDKPALYAEVLRVLRPGGRFIASDWLFGDGAAEARSIRDWLEDNPLGFIFTTPEEAKAELDRAGFEDSYVIDRRDFLARVFEQEIVRLEGPARQELARLVGPDMAADRATGARLRIAAIRAGCFKPSHLGGRKRQVSPVAGSPELRR